MLDKWLSRKQGCFDEKTLQNVAFVSFVWCCDEIATMIVLPQNASYGATTIATEGLFTCQRAACGGRGREKKVGPPPIGRFGDRGWGGERGFTGFFEGLGAENKMCRFFGVNLGSPRRHDRRPQERESPPGGYAWRRGGTEGLIYIGSVNSGRDANATGRKAARRSRRTKHFAGLGGFVIADRLTHQLRRRRVRNMEAARVTVVSAAGSGTVVAAVSAIFW